jgi:hypothetical protein
MSQLEHIEAIEKRLWSAADNLRATLPKSEYQELDNDPTIRTKRRVGTEKRLPDENNHAA